MGLGTTEHTDPATGLNRTLVGSNGRPVDPNTGMVTLPPLFVPKEYMQQTNDQDRTAYLRGHLFPDANGNYLPHGLEREGCIKPSGPQYVTILEFAGAVLEVCSLPPLSLTLTL